MSLNRKRELNEIAKVICRDLRKNSTMAEKIFWEAVRNKRFVGKKFYRQYPLFYDITGKESFFIADFYCHQEKLVVELDGIIHKYRLKKDKKREKILNYLGLNIIRFRNDEVLSNLDGVLSRLNGTLKR